MKVYIITGASGDIGRAIAIKLAQEGNQLMLCGNHNRESLEQLSDVITGFGSAPLLYIGDLSDETCAKEVIKITLEHYGRIDGLINSVGVASLGLFTDLSTDDWSRLLNANLNSVFQMCHATVPSMVQRKQGTILNISSVWGVRGASCEVAYSAAKGGLNLLTKALAKELALSNVNVNALALGMVKTKMNAMLSEEEQASIAEEIPAGRITTPEEVADMVSLLLQAPSYLTGQIIGFDGGWF